MDPSKHFATLAESFAQWLLNDSDTGPTVARNALLHLTQLHLAALQLKVGPPDNLDDTEDIRVTDAERHTIVAKSNRLPFDMYSEFFNPLTFPPQDSYIGMLTDDLADIYRDLVTGLRYYRAGRTDQARWYWTFHFQSHWGRHATGAIYALHCWLADNSPFDLLN